MATAVPDVFPKEYVILCVRFVPARVMVKLVLLPIVQLDFVIVDFGIFAVKDTVDVPTSAEPLNVVMVTVPVPEALFAATYCARGVGTVQLTEVLVVLVVMVPDPEPNTYVRVWVS